MLLTALANFAYALMLAAFFARDVLHLRGLLVVGQALIVFYTWRTGVPIIAAWNAVYLATNAYVVVEILRERRAVTLPADLTDIHERHFSALTPQEFLRWWRQGHRETVARGSLARAGERPDALVFLITGSATVQRGGRVVTTLGGGFFVAEMSLITGEPANADVDVTEPTDLIRWPRRDLDQLRERSPLLWTKIQSALGLDLVAKVRRGEIVAASAR